jgi:hypothetical protein
MSQLDHIAIRILRRNIYDQLLVLALLLAMLAACGALI